jgi:hypothetical protein
MRKAFETPTVVDVAFAALFVVLLTLAILGLTGTVTTVVVAGGLVVFLAALGGPLARTGILVLILITAIGVGPSFAPERATEEFYSAAAQVIPVLLLTLALEVRFFQLRWLRPLSRRRGESWLPYQWRRIEHDGASVARAIVLFVAVFILVAGELDSIDALAEPGIEREHPEWVYTAVVMGLIAVAFLALFGAPNVEAQDDDGQVSWRLETHRWGRVWIAQRQGATEPAAAPKVEVPTRHKRGAA